MSKDKSAWAPSAILSLTQQISTTGRLLHTGWSYEQSSLHSSPVQRWQHAFYPESPMRAFSLTTPWSVFR